MEKPNGARKNLVLGKGLVGSQLAAYLRERGEAVEILSRGDGHDLRNAEKYLDKFRSADRVWFVAWDVGVWKKDTSAAYEAEILDSNLRLCQSIFHCLAETKTPFLFVSSQAAISDQMITLAVTKRVGELWTKILDGHIARFWNVYGWEAVGDKSHLIPDLVWKALHDGNITMMTNGDETRQFLYIRDAVEAITHQFDIGQKVADVTTGEWVPVKEMAQLVGEKLGANVTLGTKPGNPSMATPATFLDLWKPRFTLSKGLDEVINEARKWKTKNP